MPNPQTTSKVSTRYWLCGLRLPVLHQRVEHLPQRASSGIAVIGVQRLRDGIGHALTPALMITASFRATATRALFMPARLAIRMPQALIARFVCPSRSWIEV